MSNFFFFLFYKCTTGEQKKTVYKPCGPDYDPARTF